MNFRPQAPSRDVKFWSMFLFFFPGGLGLIAVACGRSDFWFHPTAIFLPFLSLVSLGLWFGSRVCGYLLFTLLLLGIPINLGHIVLSGWTNWWPMFSVLTSTAVASIVWEWLREQSRKPRLERFQ
jgi:hypothetical protein